MSKKLRTNSKSYRRIKGFNIERKINEKLMHKNYNGNKDIIIVNTLLYIILPRSTDSWLSSTTIIHQSIIHSILRRGRKRITSSVKNKKRQMIRGAKCEVDHSIIH